MTNPLIPFIAVRGAPEFPRYMIAEQRGQVWSGILWSQDDREGLLFHDPDEAAAECSDLMRQQCADKPCQAEYVVPLVIEVLSSEPVPLEAVVNWVRKPQSKNQKMRITEKGRAWLASQPH